jgi:hypothetical protein
VADLGATAVTQAAVRLGDVVDLVQLEIACRRCDRHGRVRVARLIAEHGADIGLPDLAVKLAAGCPNASAADVSTRCFVHFPQLVEALRRDGKATA